MGRTCSPGASCRTSPASHHPSSTCGDPLGLWRGGGISARYGCGASTRGARPTCPAHSNGTPTASLRLLIGSCSRADQKLRRARHSGSQHNPVRHSPHSEGNSGGADQALLEPSLPTWFKCRPWRHPQEKVLPWKEEPRAQKT